MMQRVTAPGLPSSPGIWFDAEKQQAKVTLRHPTWQSTERALSVTELVSWVVRIGVAVYVWRNHRYEDFHATFLLMLFVVAVVFPIVAGLVRSVLRNFLARQLFPTRTTLWATPQAIAIRSRLYSQPFVIWREWEGQPIGIRFIVDRDQAADQYCFSLDYKRKLSKDHLSSSAMLYVVLTTVDHELASSRSQHDASMRAIPITEIEQGTAAKVTMAYAHALALTSPQPKDTSTKTDTGIDIDAV